MSLRRFIASVSIDTVTLEGVTELTGLEFQDLGNITKLRGPFVYILVDPHGAIFYPGKAAAAYEPARRTMSYANWSADVSDYIQRVGFPDPAEDPDTGDLSVTKWSPIVRTFRRYSLSVKAAQVPDAEVVTPRMWEARIQAILGTLTTIESVVGGTAWEANEGTLRGDAYDWAIKRIEDFRKGL